MKEKIEALERAFENLKLSKLKYKGHDFELTFEKETNDNNKLNNNIDLEEELKKLKIDEELKKKGLERELESLEREKILQEEKNTIKKSEEPEHKEEVKIVEDKLTNEKGKIHNVICPIVGIFYSKPSPEKDTFVSVGEHVKKGEVLCIIEAMKMFTEIKSPVDGIIKSVKYNDEDLVEAEEVIFEIEE